jgi:hypothetical protein
VPEQVRWKCGLEYNMRTIEDDVVDVAAAVEIMWLFLNAVIVMWMQVRF